MFITPRAATFTTLTCFVLTLYASAATAQPEQPDRGEAAPPTIIRTYNVSDLMRAAVDYPLDSKVLPPTGYGVGGGLSGAVQGAGGAGLFAKAQPAPERNLLDPLSQLIIDLVDPNSWAEQGGDIGQIKSFASLLVITQTEANHAKVQALLDEIRRNAGPSQIVAVRTTWLLLEPGEVPPPASVVDDEWLKSRQLYCDGRTVCFSGQTVYISSGRARTIISDTTPIVGTNAVAFDPEVERVQSGVSVQIAAQLVPGAQAAILDLHSFASQWDEPAPPAQMTGTATTQPGGGAVTSAGVDRINMVAQAMKTTLRVPLGQKYVVGGMTLDPAGEQGARQLCLIVQLDLVK